MKASRGRALSLAVAVALFAVLAWTPAFASAATPTKLTIRATTPRTPSIYVKVKIEGFLRTSSDTPLKSSKLILERSPELKSGDTSWTVVRRGIELNSRGRAICAVRPTSNSLYRFRYAGSSKYESSKSAAMKVWGLQPEKIVVAGSGDTTVPVGMMLRKGLVEFSIESTGPPEAAGQAFKVYLMKKSGSGYKTVFKVVDSHTGFTGEHAFDLITSQKYFLKVVAGDAVSWKVTLYEPRKLSARGFGALSGTRPYVSAPFTLSRKSGTYRFHWTNPSGKSFRARLRSQDGDVVKELVPTTRGKSGARTVRGIEKAVYVIEIDASGPWTLHL
jgi:hypothetical protein